MEEIELKGLWVVKCGESQNGGNKKGDNKDRPHTSASDSLTHTQVLLCAFKSRHTPKSTGYLGFMV